MRILISLVLGLFPILLAAQAPKNLKYQAVLRNDQLEIRSNEQAAVQVEIFDGVPGSGGEKVFCETHNVTTNAIGLFTFDIGTSSEPCWPDPFNEIDWGNGDFYLLIKVDNQQIGDPEPFSSVPYALYGEDADADPQNEIQQITLDGGILSLSKGGGTVDLSDPDADPENEIQQISINANNVISLSKNGGSVLLPEDKTEDADADPNNELQEISINGTEISLSQNGGAIQLPPDEVDDADADPENEFQQLSIDGDEITLTPNGGQVFLPSRFRAGFLEMSSSSASLIINHGLGVKPKTLKIKILAVGGTYWSFGEWYDIDNDGVGVSSFTHYQHDAATPENGKTSAIIANNTKIVGFFKSVNPNITTEFNVTVNDTNVVLNRVGTLPPGNFSKIFVSWYASY